MVKYTSILVDDERQAINALKHEILVNCPEIEIIGEAIDIPSALEQIESKNPDILFLDIRLTDGLGFEILEQTRNSTMKVIFTTAYSEYAIKAFKFNALDYLLKPIEGIELRNTVKLLLQKENGELKNQLANFVSNEDAVFYEKKIAIPASDGVHLFPLKSILRLNSERNYTRIYFTDGIDLLSAKHLKEFEELLETYKFMRVHQSHLINLTHVKSYMSKDGGYILMDDKSIVPLAHRKKSEFLEKLKLL